jgi:hypothetical protein
MPGTIEGDIHLCYFKKTIGYALYKHRNTPNAETIHHNEFDLPLSKDSIDHIFNCITTSLLEASFEKHFRLFSVNLKDDDLMVINRLKEDISSNQDRALQAILKMKRDLLTSDLIINHFDEYSLMNCRL